MTEKEVTSPIEEIMKDPNIGLIAAGAVVWIISFYFSPLQPILATGGFTLVCLASAVTALKRPIENAHIGLILGAIIQIVGGYLAGVILVGWILSPLLFVGGGVLIIFYSIPLVVQTGRIPFVEEFQKTLKKEKEKISEEDEEETTEESTEYETTEVPEEGN